MLCDKTKLKQMLKSFFQKVKKKTGKVCNKLNLLIFVVCLLSAELRHKDANKNKQERYVLIS